MNRREAMKLLAAGGAVSLFMPACRKAKKETGRTRPNIIFILADDLGHGDLSCYGQKRFQTPHIDRLAANGMRFTDHYSGSTVCAPSRSCLMTGQHSGHTPIRGNKAFKPEGQHPMPAGVTSAAKRLQQAGYITGAFGKWGLGYPGSEGDPNNQGFNEFFGYNCQRFAHNYYPRHLWHSQGKIGIKENEGTQTGVYGPDLIHQKTLQFIEKNKDNPFFLFVPSIIPHAELFAPESYMKKHRGRYGEEKPYHGADEDSPRYRIGGYGSQSEPRAAFAAMVNLLDDQVGEITAKVEELGLTEDTIILFSSDNGPHLEGGADPDYFNSNGDYRGYKRDLYDGGIRVPFIASLPGRIRAGSTTGHVSAFWDFLPSVCELAGIKPPENVDGISFVPTLLGQGKQDPHSYLYWEFHERGGSQAVRLGHWKGVRLNIKENPDSPIELYDLSYDPGETMDLAEDHPDIIGHISAIMKEAHIPSATFPFISKERDVANKRS
jgi:arylsulfatase A-like enzyme